MSQSYDRQFYRMHEDDSLRSALEVVPVVLELLPVASVIDVGCGLGTWLVAFQESGVREIMGVDGPHVDRSLMHFPPDCFVARDLASPLSLDRRFDLAVSLEVAEHLPESSAPAFVESLTRLAPVVLFSAATPFQGGTSHLNEQWPEYWAELFQFHGFFPSDSVRSRVWNNPRVAYYYAQNALLFVNEEYYARHPELKRSIRRTPIEGLGRIHPRKWAEAHDPRRQSLRRVLTALPHAFSAAIRRRIPRG